MISRDTFAEAMKSATGPNPSSGSTIRRRPLGCTRVEASTHHRRLALPTRKFAGDVSGTSARAYRVGPRASGKMTPWKWEPVARRPLEYSWWTTTPTCSPRWNAAFGCPASTSPRPSDGAEALRSATETRPDAIVLDINMPILDGVSVVTALRAMDNGRAGLRVVGPQLGRRPRRWPRGGRRRTTSSSRSCSPNWWPGSRRCSAGAGPPRRSRRRTISVGPLEVDIPGRRARVNGRRRRPDQARIRPPRGARRSTRPPSCRAPSCWSWCGVTTSRQTPTSSTCSSDTSAASSKRAAPHDLLHTVRGVGFVLRQQ